MMRLAFQGPIPSRRSVICTFRVGSRWIKMWLENGEKPFEVLMVNEDDEPVEATVIAVHYKPLNTVSVHERVVDCNMPGRSWQSLYNELVRVYSSCYNPARNQPVEPSSMVSVVWFILK